MKVLRFSASGAGDFQAGRTRVECARALKGRSRDVSWRTRNYEDGVSLNVNENEKIRTTLYFAFHSFTILRRRNVTRVVSRVLLRHPDCE